MAASWRGRAAAAAALAVPVLGPGPAVAAEGAASFYLLGQRGNFAAVTPPPGLYFQFDEYVYSGDAGASLAVPAGGELNAGLEADVYLSLPTLAWAPEGEILGGRPLLALALPFGQKNISAEAALDIRGNTVLERDLSEDDFTLGDPVAVAGLGWNRGFWHWTASAAVNVPVGDYQKGRATNLAFNRWGLDLTGALTWLNTENGRELSLAAGYTTHWENEDTDYDSGDEVHLEAGLSQSLPNGLTLGLVGYYYEQVEDDSGAGAPEGGFRGRVAAFGPSVAWQGTPGGVPLTLRARYYKEFDVRNRPEGDAFYLGLVVPLGL